MGQGGTGRGGGAVPPDLPRSPCLALAVARAPQELILFSRADLERSIPNMVDGLKPGQRKIMYACFKRNLKSDVKVAQLAGYVAEHSGGWLAVQARGRAGRQQGWYGMDSGSHCGRAAAPPHRPARPRPAAYHHGEASLGSTIVGLAQDFVGSNNINYLVPQGGCRGVQV